MKKYRATFYVLCTNLSDDFEHSESQVVEVEAEDEGEAREKAFTAAAYAAPSDEHLRRDLTLEKLICL